MGFSLFGGRSAGEPHFRLAGIPVRVELSFLLVCLFFGMNGGPAWTTAAWVAIVFVSVLFHELGHALAYRLFGAQPQIVLHGMGGLTFGTRTGTFSPGQQVLISLAGPFFELLLAAAVFGFALVHGPFERGSPQGYVVGALIQMNVFWALFNLLPIVPLDGGHVLEALLSFRDPLKGRLWARYVAVPLAGLIALVAYQEGQPFVAVLMAMFGLQAFQGIGLLKAQSAPRPVAPAPPREQPEVVEDLRRMHELLETDRPLEARAVAHQVLERAEGERARDAALRALAWIAIGQGEPQQALGALARTSRSFDDPFVWGTAIAASGDAKGALPHLSQAFARMPSPQVVAAYARCLAAAGRTADARKLVPPGAPAELNRALGEALFRSRDFPGAAEANARAFDAGGGAADAYNAACARARAGEPEAALGWLGKAADAGFTDAAHLEQDPDLESLRGLPGFGVLLGRLRAPAGA